VYPLTQWSYEELCARLDLLQTSKLHAEAVVIGNQLLEQIIKRYLAREMNLKGQHWDKKNKKWVELLTKQSRDAAVRELTEPENWKTEWRKLLHEQKSHLPIDQAFNQAVGSNAWATLTNRSKMQMPPGLDTAESSLLYGFRQCRHILVHGMTSPRAHELEFFSRWGTTAIKKILHPETGWPDMLGWSAQQRLPNFRAHKSEHKKTKG
jgi:hypothetical protein